MLFFSPYGLCTDMLYGHACVGWPDGPNWLAVAVMGQVLAGCWRVDSEQLVSSCSLVGPSKEAPILLNSAFLTRCLRGSDQHRAEGSGTLAINLLASERARALSAVLAIGRFYPLICCTFVQCLDLRYPRRFTKVNDQGNKEELWSSLQAAPLAS